MQCLNNLIGNSKKIIFMEMEKLEQELQKYYLIVNWIL